MTFDSNSPHARVHEGLRLAFQKKDLDEVQRWLELGPSPRFERQQVVREVLRPDEETGLPTFLQWALDTRWAAVIPLLVQAGARLDIGPMDMPPDEPGQGDDAVPSVDAWYSAVHGLLGLSSIQAAQTRPPAPGRRAKPAQAGPRPDEDPLVMTLRTLCTLGARLNGRNDQGMTPLALVIGGTGWWAPHGSAIASDPDAPSVNVGEALLRTLLDAQADPNRPDFSGNRTLHDLVAQVVSFRPYLWVLNAGGDPRMANDTGTSAEDTAHRVLNPAMLAAMAELEKRALRKALSVDGTTDATAPAGARRRL